MKQKRKVNRYTIGILDKKETRKIKNRNYITELINNINEYNNNPNNSYLLGDLEINKRDGIVTFNRYLKVTKPSTLEEIDALTTGIETEQNLKKLYNISGEKPLIILYKANRRIKTLPIIFNTKYIDRIYIKQKFMTYARDVKFLNLILNNKQIIASLRESLESFYNLCILRERLINTNIELVSLSKAEEFFSAFISDGKSHFNYFNFRLIAVIIKTYESELEPEKKEESREIPGQIVLEGYNRLILKSHYETLKEVLMEEGYEEAKKTLKQTHKTTK